VVSRKTKGSERGQSKIGSTRRETRSVSGEGIRQLPNASYRRSRFPLRWLCYLPVQGLLESGASLVYLKPCLAKVDLREDKMADGAVMLRRAAERGWQLLRDEGFQNKNQPKLPTKARIQKRVDPALLGSIEFPIGVNGVLGELSYLSLLRTDTGVPLAFHRIGSFESPQGIVDGYDLLSIDTAVDRKLYLDPYYRLRSRQAPLGFKLTDKFDPDNPIYGVNVELPRFPFEVAQPVRELQKRVFGIPFPVDRLRAFEAHLKDKILSSIRKNV